MLTIDQFNLIPAGKMFYTSTVSDNIHGINMSASDRLLRFVAVKGHVDDWAVYCLWADHPADYICEVGDKVRHRQHIGHCVPCDDEVFARYRC